MFTRKLVTAMFLLGLVMAPPASAVMPRMPMPPGKILVDGETYTITGRLSVQAVDGRTQATLTQLSERWYQRETLYYPAATPAVMVMPAPGMPRLPRPPYRFTPVSTITLEGQNGRDLLALAKAVGTGASVELTGTWGYFDTQRVLGVLHGLTVTRVTLRGHEVPESLPSVQRMIAAAKQAARAHLEETYTRSDVRTLTAKYAGALLVDIQASLSGVGPRSLTVIYDVLTGEIMHRAHILPARE